MCGFEFTPGSKYVLHVSFFVIVVVVVVSF